MPSPWPAEQVARRGGAVDHHRAEREQAQRAVSSTRCSTGGRGGRAGGRRAARSRRLCSQPASTSARKCVAARLEVGVLVEARAGRREQHDLAGAGGGAGARDRALHVAVGVQRHAGRGERGGDLRPRPRRSGAPTRSARRRAARAARSPAPSCGRRGSGGRAPGGVGAQRDQRRVDVRRLRVVHVGDAVDARRSAPAGAATPRNVRRPARTASGSIPRARRRRRRPSRSRGCAAPGRRISSARHERLAAPRDPRRVLDVHAVVGAERRTARGARRRAARQLVRRRDRDRVRPLAPERVQLRLAVGLEASRAGRGGRREVQQHRGVGRERDRVLELERGRLADDVGVRRRARRRARTSAVPTLPATATGSPASRWTWPIHSVVVVLPFVPVTAMKSLGSSRQASSSSPTSVEPARPRRLHDGARRAARPGS